jgi:serine protease
VTSRPVSRGLRLLALALPLATALVPQGGTAAGTADHTAVVPHLMSSLSAVRHARSAAPPAAPASPLQYQSAGAPIEAPATVYLVFWGPQWSVGWSDVSTSGNVYTSGQAQQYVTDYFKYLSGSATAWNAVTTQYCSGVAVGSTSCSGGTHVGNPPIFGGAWVDATSPPPPTLVPDNCAALVCLVPGSSLDSANLMAAEAVRAQQHFLGSGYNANANYMIMLPEATLTLGADALYCAYHSQAKDSSSRWLSFTNMPYINTGNVGCGANFVNADNSYGNGFFDGYSIVAGHEFAETETDALPFTNPAWRDSSGAENGDKCAWITPGTAGGAHNIGPDAGGHSFAVQTTYSNSASGCAG